MATSKARAKAKLKKNIGRIAKMKLGNIESCEADNADLSQLRKPIDINLSSLRKITQLFEKGSDEVRDILTYECDIIYECRICRSLFRSFANFISHKRVYCLEKYSVMPRKYSTDPTNTVYYNNNSNKQKLNDFDYKKNCLNDRILRSQASRKEPKKDLTSVVDMLIRKQDNDFQCDNICNERENTCPLRISSDNEQVLLEMVDSNQAAYQTIMPSQISLPNNCDLMKTQTEELTDMSNRSTAILGPDGHFHDIYSNIPRCGSQDENNDFDFDMNVPNSVPGEDLTCSTCNAKFATKKTLMFHFKCKHMPHRMGFSCPCCPSTFTNRWSVYRHLFKVHRKSNEQVRRLRSQIQARDFQRDTSRLEKISKSSEADNQQMEKETQEWLEHMELDTELQRCGACGKRFDRKAALTSHSQICKKRVAVGTRGQFTGRHKRASKHPPQRIGQIIDSTRNCSDVNDQPLLSGETITEPLSSNTDIKNLNTSEPQQPSVIAINSESPKETMEIAIRVEDVSSLSKDAWDMIGTEYFSTDAESTCVQSDSSMIKSNRQDPPVNSNSREIVKTVDVAPDTKTSLINENLDIPEVIYTSMDNSRPVALSVLDTEKKLGIQYRGIRLPTVTLEKINITPNHSDAASLKPALSLDVSATGSKVTQVDKKLSSLANIRKLQCIPCNRKFVSLLALGRHIAVHRRRSRYICKLCDFQAFLKCDFIAHCNKKHNAKNNRKILSDLIIEIPVNNGSSGNDTPNNEEDIKKQNELEVLDMTCGNRNFENLAQQPMESDQRDNKDENKNNNLLIDRPICTVSNDTVAKAKPRRGRPPKSKGCRQKKAVIRKSVRKVRHVSPPTLNEELSEPDEVANVTDSLAPVKQSSTKAGELSRLRAPSKIDCDPELRKMVMEVIFGPAEKQIDNTDKQSNVIPIDDITIEQLETEVLDHREDGYSENEIMKTKESNTPWQIEMGLREDIEIQCEQVSLSNNNLKQDLKAVTFREGVSILRTPIVLARRISPNNCLVKLQTRDIQCDTTLSNKIHQDSLSLSPRDTVRLAMYEHGNPNDKSIDMRHKDIHISAER